MVRGLGELLSDEPGAGVGCGLGVVVFDWLRAGATSTANIANMVQVDFITCSAIVLTENALPDARIDIVSYGWLRKAPAPGVCSSRSFGSDERGSVLQCCCAFAPRYAWAIQAAFCCLRLSRSCS